MASIPLLRRASSDPNQVIDIRPTSQERLEGIDALFEHKIALLEQMLPIAQARRARTVGERDFPFVFTLIAIIFVFAIYMNITIRMGNAYGGEVAVGMIAFTAPVLSIFGLCFARLGKSVETCLKSRRKQEWANQDTVLGRLGSAFYERDLLDVANRVMNPQLLLQYPVDEGSLRFKREFLLTLQRLVREHPELIPVGHHPAFFFENLLRNPQQIGNGFLVPRRLRNPENYIRRIAAVYAYFSQHAGFQDALPVISQYMGYHNDRN